MNASPSVGWPPPECDCPSYYAKEDEALAEFCPVHGRDATENPLSQGESRMTITPDTARQCAEALRLAEKSAPITAVKFEMRRRALEWERAARDLGDADDEGTPATIMVFAAVLPSMYVWCPTSEGEDPWLTVVRQLRTGGQVSLHLDTPWDGRGRYVNLHSEASPVVVQS